ncbi:125 kDa kinesin-related protein isoform X1 [Zea mays]|uniref:Kinesin-like protein KIN-5B n=3 Tax=Zea mays TaxID=4577 RepID=A0A1D6JYF8_MAIZE|nr:125 kDa kinesin-related protein [Zea mays]XP_008654288.1 125 kDa kinesin-related protein isoform X1 [Zea mays]ONL96695.1 Kinesin-like protein KIN-5B [Zea mays]|eukprot:NP_001333655.1 125 kDa kinesin-related protein [Zea mays]
MAQTPNPSRRSWVGPAPMPFLTPRPERRHLEMRWADGVSQSAARRSGVGAVARDGCERDQEVNVQVMLRCRPLSEEEQRVNAQSAISCNESKREVTVLHSLFKQADKTFTFDKVFGPQSQQRSIYNHAVAPLVTEVLEGYNCTVFVFGQTGTGKTYTMEGEMRQKVSELPDTAGVIPRAVCHIFEILTARKADYSMKVTFLELYNEDITDLLSLEDQSRFPEGRQKRPITLMEDGKGGAVIRGLEEIVVYSPSDIYSLLEHGSARRRTADTALNKQSSRSHAVFSINIQVKETTVGNEELIKYGRLNLVDLAGSENIARSGAREGRARETGEMNKSLLTLGRVINALVEHSVHVPYRDSKLTRLLRESLGGKAKTCIIATVSPSAHSLEETLVTLDYAARAKSIRNKPEANKKTCKTVVLKELYQEMERMKQDVKAAREKNGIYISHERFAQDETKRKTMKEKIEHLELSLEKQNKEVQKFKALYLAEQECHWDFESQNNDLKVNLESLKGKFIDLEEAHCRAHMSLREKDFIISNLLHSEHLIIERAKDMRNTLENATEDISVLLNKQERQSKTEAENKRLLSGFRAELDRSLGVLHATVVGSVCEQSKILESINEQTKLYFLARNESENQLERRIARAKDMYVSGVQCMKELANTMRQQSIIDSEQMRQNISTNANAIGNFLEVMFSEAEQVLNDVLKSTSDLKELLAFSAELQNTGLRRNLASVQAMSKQSIDFFEDIRIHVSQLMTLMEQNQMERSSKLVKFENEFKETCVKDEQAALNKIAAILSELTAKKTTMVSSYMGQLNERYSEDQKNLKLEISNLQQVSDNGKNESVACVGVIESQFQEDMSSHTKSNDQMEGILKQYSEKGSHFVSYWSHIQSSLHDLVKSSIMETDDFIEESRNKNENIFQEGLLFSSQNDAEFHGITSDVLTVSKNSLLLDHETCKMVETNTTIFSDHLELLNEKHSEGVESTRNMMSDCLEKDYMANSPVRNHPRELLTSANSLESIDKLRASLPDLVAKFRLENKLNEMDKGKQYSDQRTRTPRSPLTPVNQ